MSFSKIDPSLSSLLHEGCFPTGCAIVPSEKGSMTMEITPFYVEYQNKFVRGIERPSIFICATLEGHSSRKGIEYLKNTSTGT